MSHSCFPPDKTEKGQPSVDDCPSSIDGSKGLEPYLQVMFFLSAFQASVFTLERLYEDITLTK